MATNPNHILFDEFKRKYDRLLTPIVTALQKQNWEPKDIDKNIDRFIQSIFATQNFEEKFTGLTVEMSISAFAVGGLPIAQSKIKETTKWLLKNNWNPEALSLSKTIHSSVKKIKAEVGVVMKETLGQSVNWKKTANKISKIKDIKAELPKYIKDLLATGKKVLNDPAAINEFNKKVKKYQKQIDSLSNLGYENSRLKKAYQNIIAQVKKGSAEGLKKAAERAVKAKTSYIAERIARTEIANAYGNAVVYRAQKDKQIVGIRSVLSSRHSKPDICDIHANVNQFGLGKGTFPKKNVPRYTYHPNCLCSLVPVTQHQVDKTKKVIRSKQIKKYTDLHPDLLDKKGNIPFYTDDFLKPKVPGDLD